MTAVVRPSLRRRLARLGAASTSITATTSLVVLLVGAPVLVVQRVGRGLFPLRPLDLLLALALLIWAQLVVACVERDEVPPRRPVVPWVLHRSTHRLVELSVFGLGAIVREDVVDACARDLAASVAFEDLDPATAVAAVGPVVAATPASEPGEPIATTEHVTARGETFWSLAQELLHDGREWEVIRDLNIGREVAPGVVMAADDGLRAGWTILVPAHREAVGS